MRKSDGSPLVMMRLRWPAMRAPPVRKMVTGPLVALSSPAMSSAVAVHSDAHAVRQVRHNSPALQGFQVDAIDLVHPLIAPVQDVFGKVHGNSEWSLDDAGIPDEFGALGAVESRSLYFWSRAPVGPV